VENINVTGAACNAASVHFGLTIRKTEDWHTCCDGVVVLPVIDVGFSRHSVDVVVFMVMVLLLC